MQRRGFNLLPSYLKTQINSKMFKGTIDAAYEPESSEFISGYIGDVSGLSQKELDRTPHLADADLSFAAFLRSEDDKDVILGATTYDDFLNSMMANGALTDDVGRLFGSTYHSFLPPIDLDKFLNPARYYWTGDGDAWTAEYVVKEIKGSKTTIHQRQGTTFVSIDVPFDQPVSPAKGQLWEDNRVIKVWNGTEWENLVYNVVDDFPAIGDSVENQYFYVRQYQYQRPVLWIYSKANGRWSAVSPIVGDKPTTPVEGMIWEDSSTVERKFKIYQNGAFVDLVFDYGFPTGEGNDQEVIYDTRTPDPDGWSAVNHWRHWNDMSIGDRKRMTKDHAAKRPIIEFWYGLEETTTKTTRNQAPLFKVYALDENLKPYATGNESQIFGYERPNKVTNDTVLGFPLEYDESGEIVFKNFLEQDDMPDVTGYRLFKDTTTNTVRSIWDKSENFHIGDPPPQLFSNPDHETLDQVSRRHLIDHISGIMKSQDGFTGDTTGANNYRWVKKDETKGAVIIDHNFSMLRNMAILNANISVPMVLRKMQRDYNRILRKFIRRMENLWNDGTISNPDDTLAIPASAVVDGIFTEFFIGKDASETWFYNDFGTYTETRLNRKSYTVVGSTKNIMIPPSPARMGIIPAFEPKKFTKDDTDYLLNHDGVVMPAFGDFRDDIWLDLQWRFYNSIPSRFSATSEEPFSLNHRTFVGNYKKPENFIEVQYVADDYQTLSMNDGERALDTSRAWVVTQSGASVNIRPLVIGEYVTFGSTWYHYNGWSVHTIDFFDQDYGFLYATNEADDVLKQEFDRWVTAKEIIIPEENEEYDPDDPFTWNYSQYGIEGHYKGIYRRLYGTPEPHREPWKIAGYHVEPSWWRTTYPPNDTRADGSPVYYKNNTMWTSLKQNPEPFRLVAPKPVDDKGNLLDPIKVGIVDGSKIPVDSFKTGFKWGDGGPLEESFRQDLAYSFSYALWLFLLRPLEFVERFWDETLEKTKDDTETIAKGPYLINSDTRTRKKISEGDYHIETLDQESVRMGVNAWCVEFFRDYSRRDNTTLKSVISNTFISQCWNTHSFIKDEFTKIFTVGGVRVLNDDFFTMLHRSQPVEERFASGIRIVRDQSNGYRIYGYDQINPVFRYKLPERRETRGIEETKEDFVASKDERDFKLTSIVAPKTGKSGANYTIGVLVNGIRIKDEFFDIDGDTVTISDDFIIEGGETISVVYLGPNFNVESRTKMFKVKNVGFSYTDVFSKETGELEYGTLLLTDSEVIEFMLGYGQYLVEQGWVFDERDEASGELIDFMYGAKSFATWILEGEDDEFFFTPFRKSIRLRVDRGVVEIPDNLHYGVYGILDRDSDPIPIENFILQEDDDHFSIQNTGEDSPAGIRVFIREYQHVVALPRTTKFNDVLYSSVLADFQDLYRIETFRIKDSKGKIHTPGFFLIEGSILPNFEKQAKDFVRFYDVHDAPEDPAIRDAARNLYGWYVNEFRATPDGTFPLLSALNATDVAQLDFHLGMIHAKGTVKPFKAYATGTDFGNEGFDVVEDWLWKFEDYGDTRIQKIAFNLDRLEFDNRTEIIDINQISDSEWVVEPKEGFKIDRTKSPYIKIVDTVEDQVIMELFHYDPALGFQYNDPKAIENIDIISPFDPAGYTDPTEDVNLDRVEIWDASKVGTIWWNTSITRYSDYIGRWSQDKTLASREWGSLLKFNATITRTDDVVTVTTLDVFTGQPADHGLTPESVVLIEGADQEDYNGNFVVETVPSSSTFTFTIDVEADTPATGEIVVHVSDIEILEWIESDIQPEIWAATEQLIEERGEPWKGVDTPYTTTTVKDPSGETVTKYYFWLKNAKEQQLNKDFSAETIRGRLLSPSSAGVPWCAFPDDHSIIVHFGDDVVRENYMMIMTMNETTSETHEEWILVSGLGTESPHLKFIIEKIADSISGIDFAGNSVPYPDFNQFEKMGTSRFPPKTVFLDRDSALKTFQDAANEVFKGINLRTLGLIEFKTLLDGDKPWWSPSAYHSPDYDGREPFDIVPTKDFAEERASEGAYIRGDIIEVTSDESFGDFWSHEPVKTRYLYEGNGVFTLMMIENQTVSFDLEGLTDLEKREAILFIFDIIPSNKKYFVLNRLFEEMMITNNDADWIIKTSYISTSSFESPLDRSIFVKPDQNKGMEQAILEYKPYRTKLRAFDYRYAPEREDVSFSLEEELVTKAVSLFDRLSCYVSEDAGFDIFAFDDEPRGFDTTVWTQSEDGKPVFVLLEIIETDGVSTEYELKRTRDVTNNPFKVVFKKNGIEFDPAVLGISWAVNETLEKPILKTSAPLPVDVVVEFWQTDILLVNVDESVMPFQHHTARAMAQGIYAPFENVGTCAPPLNGAFERTEYTTSAIPFILVKNEWSSVYEGFDMTPYDSVGFDDTPSDIGRRTFAIAANNASNTPSGYYTLPTSEATKINGPYVTWKQPHEVAEFRVGSQILEEDVDFERISSQGIKLLRRNSLEYTVGFGVTSFDASTLPFGVEEVLVDGVKQQEGVDYQINGTSVDFIRVPVTTSTVYGYQLLVEYTGDGVTTNFDTTWSPATINKNNLMVFVNGILQDPSTYNMSGSDVVFIAAPGAGDDVQIYLLASNYNNSPVAFDTYYVGNGASVSFSYYRNVGKDNIIVFVNGVLQNQGTDYTVPTAGTVLFAAPPAPGDRITIKSFESAFVDTITMNNQSFTASGAAVDTLPETALDSASALVFINGVLQQSSSYTLSSSTISWVAAPAPGDVINIVEKKDFVVRDFSTTSFYPAENSTVTIVPKMPSGDLDVYFKSFHVGTWGDFRVVSIPVGWSLDRIRERIVLDTLVKNDVLIIYWKNPKYISQTTAFMTMEPYVADFVATLSEVDGTSGFVADPVTGSTFLDKSTDTVYAWNGTTWLPKAFLGAGDKVYSVSEAILYEHDGTSLNQVFTLGSSSGINLPFFQYPAFGEGVASATYILGQTTNASTDFPGAYNILTEGKDHGHA